jgi:formiminotetrahydrofolate cyclodeaminase
MSSSPSPAPGTPAGSRSPSFEEYLASIAAKTPTPGGGAVASWVGALSAALAGMVVSYSVSKKSLAEHAGWLAEVQHRLERARTLMMTLAREDEAAYGLVNELMKLPPGDARREAEMPAAVQAAVQVPTAVAAAAVDLLRLYLEVAPRSNTMLHSDLGIAAELALATAASSIWNVKVNVGSLPEADRAPAVARSEHLLTQAEVLRDRVAEACRPHG